MAIAIRNATPDPPEEGKAFTFDVTNGVPPYEVTYIIGDGEAQTFTSQTSDIKIDIPAGSRGELLSVGVEDGQSSTASDSWTIA